MTAMYTPIDLILTSLLVLVLVLLCFLAIRVEVNLDNVIDDLLKEL